jgi:hypothetical protein
MTPGEYLQGLTPFQKLALPALAALLVLEAAGLWRERVGRGVRWLRAAVWLAAAAAIAWPGLTQTLADALGIGRGTDLVFYLFVLAAVGVAFYFYSRLVRLQRQVTQLVRHAAIREARRGEFTTEHTESTERRQRE